MATTRIESGDEVDMTAAVAAELEQCGTLRNVEITKIDEISVELEHPNKLKIVKNKNMHVLKANIAYLPNLNSLVLPKTKFIQRGGFDLIPICMKEFAHDAVAAVQLAGSICTGFNMPRNLFPKQAPLYKITYLPKELLPNGYDKGGVFASGILPRRFYPSGLLTKEQCGPTPALFVGHQYKPPPLIVATSIDTIEPCEPLPESAALMRCNTTIAIAVPAMYNERPKLLRAKKSKKIGGYMPDLSNVTFNANRNARIAYALLSTILHPHAPMRHNSKVVPRFDLPAELFLNCDKWGQPIWLPKKYLPAGFQAGCVFGPNAIPSEHFPEEVRHSCVQPQYDLFATPPAFVGLWKSEFWPNAIDVCELTPTPTIANPEPPKCWLSAMKSDDSLKCIESERNKNNLDGDNKKSISELELGADTESDTGS